jgi:hypothetical protein
VAAPALGALGLLGPASAGAASTNPASDQYGGGGVLGVNAGGSLPFTGANLIVLLGLGLGMVAVGVGLRRIAGRNAPVS